MLYLKNHSTVQNDFTHNSRAEEAEEEEEEDEEDLKMSELGSSKSCPLLAVSF